MRGDVVQANGIARHGARDGAVHIATAYLGNDFRKLGLHRHGTEGANQVGLCRCADAHSTASQIAQTFEWPGAKRDLGGVDIDGQYLNAVALTHDALEVGPKSGH